MVQEGRRLVKRSTNLHCGNANLKENSKVTVELWIIMQGSEDERSFVSLIRWNKGCRMENKCSLSQIKPKLCWASCEEEVLKYQPCITVADKTWTKATGKHLALTFTAVLQLSSSHTYKATRSHRNKWACLAVLSATDHCVQVTAVDCNFTDCAASSTGNILRTHLWEYKM